MVVFLCMLALGMMATGISAILFGSSIINVERGWTMVIAGSVGASGGAVLLGVALAAQRLGRIAREIIHLRDRLETIGEMQAEQGFAPLRETLEPDAYEEDPPPPLQPAPPRNQAPPQDYARQEPPPQAPAAPPERVVVGQYESGGNAYTMYADGSIDAMTPAGLRRFASLDQLRAFVAAGGERI